MSPLFPLACALLGWADPPPSPSQSGPSPLAVVEALETALGDAIAKAEPSVVAIAREKTEEGEETLAVRGKPREVNQPDLRFGPSRSRLSSPNWLSFDYGSGVVIGDRGEILTAFHVVRGARVLTVRAAERQSFEAEVIAADPRSDLAVIVPRALEGVAPPKLKPIILGDSNKLRKGSFLLALGNPFNAARDGSPSASWGILANVARSPGPLRGRRKRYPPGRAVAPPPDVAPARREAESRHERRRGDQPQGGASGGHHHRRREPGRVRRDGRLRDPHGRHGPPRGRGAQARQGGRVRHARHQP